MIKRKIKEFTLDYGDNTGLECTVPCSLYSVLHAHGIIDDPYFASNAAVLRALSDKGCTFSARFSLPLGVSVMQNQLLRLRGVDTLASVSLNGIHLGTTDNMHRSYTFDVKGVAVDGENLLTVEFSSPTSREGIAKAAYMLGGELSAALPDMGIFRSVELVAFEHKMIDGVVVHQRHEGGAVSLELSLRTLGEDDMSRAVATLISPAGNVYYGGFAGGKGLITVKEPNLWWPNGLGPQNLYKLSVNLYSDSQIEDSYEMRIGLRTLALSEDGCGLVVNGVRFLTMGALYAPEDCILPNITKERTRRLLSDAKRANINTLEILPDGHFPPDHFYDLCDELGIVLWQNLPRDLVGILSADGDGCLAALESNLGRIAQHPSLAVVLQDKWEEGSEDNGEADDAAYSIPALVRRILPDALILDPVGDERSMPALIGDGMETMPSSKTVATITAPEDANLFVPALESHIGKRDAAIRMLSHISESYRYPYTMEDLCYASQLAAAQNISGSAQIVRRERSAHSGLIFDRLNDCWPSVSTSSIDYLGRWKALHYAAKKFFAPVLVSARADGTRVTFSISNEAKIPFDGSFSYSVVSTDNTVIFKDSFPIKVDALVATDVFNCDLTSVVSGHEEEYILVYSISGGAESSGKLLFTSVKNLALKSANVSVNIVGGGTSFSATVTSDALALGVFIDFVGVDAVLDDNFFDICDRAPRRISISTSTITTAADLTEMLRVRTVYDIGR